MKLLIIDNDPEAVDLVELSIGLGAWPEATILSASNGDKGIFAVASKEPNLGLLDVNVPDVEGLTVCKEISRFQDGPTSMLT